MWPLIALIVGALAVFAVLGVMQLRSTEEVFEGPRIYSDHDAYIEQLLKGHAGGESQANTQLDPWAQRLIRERQAGGSGAASGDGATQVPARGPM